MSRGTEPPPKREGPAGSRGLDAAGNGGGTETPDVLALRFEELRAVHELTQAVARANSLADVFEVALDGILRALEADRASILLLDDDGVFRFRAWRGLSDAYRTALEGHSPWTSDTVDPEPITVEDVMEEPALADAREVILEEGIRALAFVPLVHGGRLIGKFMLYHDRPHAFSADELRLGTTIAGHVALSVTRRLAEEALRASRDQLAIIFSGVADGITVQVPGGGLVFANEAAVRQLGFGSLEELLAAPIDRVRENFDLLDEERKPLALQNLPGRAALGGEHPPALTVGWRDRASGEERWSIVRSAPVLSPEGTVQMAVNIFHDITEHKLREAEREGLLRRIELEHGLLETVLRQMPAGVIIAEAPSGKLVLGNQQVEAIWRHPFLASAEIGESTAYEGFHADGGPYAPAEWPLARAITHGEVVTGEEIRIRRGDGTAGTIEVDASPIHDPSGAVVAGVVAFHDVTERKRRDDDLRFLGEASEVLGSSLDYETTLERVARLAVPHFADWCAVHMVREDGSIQVLALSHVDPEKRRWAEELDRRYPVDPDQPTGVPDVLRRGEPDVVAEITDDMLVAAAKDEDHLEILRQLGMRSYMCVPLLARGRTLGAVAFVAAESGRSYGPDDLALAQELARRAGLSVDNARLYREAENERARLAAVTQSLAEGVYALDREGRVIFVNPAAEARLGWTAAELLGRDMHETIHYRRLDGSPYPPEECPLLAALVTGDVVHREDDGYVRKDGTMMPVSYTRLRSSRGRTSSARCLPSMTSPSASEPRRAAASSPRRVRCSGRRSSTTRPSSALRGSRCLGSRTAASSTSSSGRARSARSRSPQSIRAARSSSGSWSAGTRAIPGIRSVRWAG